MISLHAFLIFVTACILLAISPGPNIIYLLSRSICQGRAAGMVSLLGVVCGFFIHLLAASVGLTALFLAVPMAYEWLKWAGAAYLVYLAWQSLKPNARSPFETQNLSADSPRKLFLMGFLTSSLNPKIAVFYVSIFPQFITPEHGSILAQSLILGFTQITISFTVNCFVILSAAQVAKWFAQNPVYLKVQRYVMGFVLLGLAVRLALQRRSA